MQQLPWRYRRTASMMNLMEKQPTDAALSARVANAIRAADEGDLQVAEQLFAALYSSCIDGKAPVVSQCARIDA